MIITSTNEHTICDWVFFWPVIIVKDGITTHACTKLTTSDLMFPYSGLLVLDLHKLNC